MRDLAKAAVAGSHPLPDQYHRLYRVWFVFGFPAFFSVATIFWLMLVKPPTVLF